MDCFSIFIGNTSRCKWKLHLDPSNTIRRRQPAAKAVCFPALNTVLVSFLKITEIREAALTGLS